MQTNTSQEPLEAVIKDEVLRMYQEVASNPEGEFHFHHGHVAARTFGYDDEWLTTFPKGAIESFAGVGNPHPRAAYAKGETVLDLGSGSGLDAIIAAKQVGSEGSVIGIDINPEMLEKARVNASEAGVANAEFRQGPMENIPVDDNTVDLVISNGVINLSFRKRRVIEELFRVLKPGGRVSFTDIVSAKQLSQSIVNDPKLWAA